MFYRTIFFIKVNETLKRIPWDLIRSDDSEGFFISPMPVNLEFDSKLQTGAYIPVIDDLLSDPDRQVIIDPIEKIEYFESEADFTRNYDNVNAQYISDSDQSGEFGYPRL
jgi:hypothetical protein